MGKGMREQHEFSLRPSARLTGVRVSIYLAVTLYQPKPLGGFNKTCYMISPNGKDVREQH